MDEMIKTVSTAALVSLMENHLFHNKKEKSSMEKQSNLWKIARTVLIVIGAVVVVCGIVYAVLRFLQPKEEGEYSFLRPREEDDEDEEYRDDPDIAGEFDEEQ